MIPVTGSVDLTSGPTPTVRPDRGELLQASARGWHGVQLAVLGFIGLCGALQPASPRPGPEWLGSTAAGLVLAGLGSACLGIVLVAGAAWPLRPRATEVAASSGAERRLRVGVGLTFLAVVLVALATSSAWWPVARADLVELSSGTATLCGRLVDSGSGLVSLDVGGQVLQVRLAEVSALRSVDAC